MRLPCIVNALHTAILSAIFMIRNDLRTMQNKKLLFVLMTVTLSPLLLQCGFGLSGCERAMKTAAAVSAMEDVNEDLNPAFKACDSLNEFKEASSKYPDALDGVDELLYATNRCTGDASLKSTPICSEVLQK